MEWTRASPPTTAELEALQQEQQVLLQQQQERLGALASPPATPSLVGGSQGAAGANQHRRMTSLLREKSGTFSASSCGTSAFLLDSPSSTSLASTPAFVDDVV